MSTVDVATDVIRLFKNQIQASGSVRLLSIKVELPEGCNADEVSKYIEDNCPQYKAHSKASEKPVLAIGHRR